MVALVSVAIELLIVAQTVASLVGLVRVRVELQLALGTP